MQELLENFLIPHNDQAMQEQQSHIEFFKLITPKLNENTQKRLRYIEKCFHLLQKYDLNIANIQEFAPYDNRIKYLEEILERVIKRSQNAENICKYFIDEICDLAQSLELCKMLVTRMLCQRMKSLPLTCALTYYIMEIVDCNAENMPNFVDATLELLAQQIHLSKTSQNSSLAALLNDNDPLAFPIAYKLLTQATLHEHVDVSKYTELMELINFVRIASSSYPFEAVENFYNDREMEISKLINEAFSADTDISGVDKTLNFSTSINMSFDVKPKKRVSVSVFDDPIEMIPQQTQNKVMYK